MQLASTVRGLLSNRSAAPNLKRRHGFRRFRSGLRSKVKVWCVGAFYSEKGCRSLQPLREGIQVFQQHVEPFKAPEDQSFGRLERRWARQSVHETYNFVGDLQR